MKFGYISTSLEFSENSYVGVCNYICNFGVYVQEEILENSILDYSDIGLFLI